jgi:hypothetical protein
MKVKRLMGDTIEPRGIDIRSEDALVILSQQASSSAGWTENDARYLLDKINKLKKAGTWPSRLEGKPKTWERFCSEVLGYDAAYIQKIAEGVAVLEAQGVHAPTVRQAVDAATRAEVAKPQRTNSEGKLGNKNASKVRNDVDNVKVVSQGGNNADYLTARIARDHPAILARMKRGEFKSVRAAAKEAGLVRDEIRVLRDPHLAARALKRAFNRAEINMLIKALSEDTK